MSIINFFFYNEVRYIQGELCSPNSLKSLGSEKYLEVWKLIVVPFFSFLLCILDLFTWPKTLLLMQVKYKFNITSTLFHFSEQDAAQCYCCLLLSLSTMVTALLLGAEHPSLSLHPEKTILHIYRFLVVVTEVVYNIVKVM